MKQSYVDETGKKSGISEDEATNVSPFQIREKLTCLFSQAKVDGILNPPKARFFFSNHNLTRNFPNNQWLKSMDVRWFSSPFPIRKDFC